MSKRNEARTSICQENSIDILYAFGSRALEVREWFKKTAFEFSDGTSDFDIGQKPSPGVIITMHERVHIAQVLEDLLGVTRVDVVTLPEADPFLAANVIRGECLNTQDRCLADEYDLYIAPRWRFDPVGA